MYPPEDYAHLPAEVCPIFRGEEKGTCEEFRHHPFQVRWVGEKPPEAPEIVYARQVAEGMYPADAS